VDRTAAAGIWSMQAEALAREVIAKLRAAGIRPIWWAAACAICCSHESPRTTTSRPTRAPMDHGSLPEVGARGAHFGVYWCAIIFEQVEVANLPQRHEYLDGRHPEHLRFETDPRQDVLRRDFTINGLMMEPGGR